jgi:hypothetical protein
LTDEQFLTPVKFAGMQKIIAGMLTTWNKIVGNENYKRVSFQQILH